MKSIILAAGYATRMFPLTENFPKPLLPVKGKPLLNLLLDDLDSLPGISEHIIVSNHKFIKHFEQWNQGLHYKNQITILDDGTTDNEHRLGAVMDIEYALQNIRDRQGTGALHENEDFIVLAGDNLLTFSLAGFVNYAQKKKTSCVMCHVENDLRKKQRTAIITTDDSDRITSFEEKPIDPKGNLAVPPFYYYVYADIQRIPEALADGCASDAPGSFAGWLSKQTDVFAFLMPGIRYDIGNLEQYSQVRALFDVS